MFSLQLTHSYVTNQLLNRPNMTDRHDVIGMIDDVVSLRINCNNNISGSVLIRVLTKPFSPSVNIIIILI